MRSASSFNGHVDSYWGGKSEHHPHAPHPPTPPPRLRPHKSAHHTTAQSTSARQILRRTPCRPPSLAEPQAFALVLDACPPRGAAALWEALRRPTRPRQRPAACIPPPLPSALIIPNQVAPPHGHLIPRSSNTLKTPAQYSARPTARQHFRRDVIEKEPKATAAAAPPPRTDVHPLCCVSVLFFCFSRDSSGSAPPWSFLPYARCRFCAMRNQKYTFLCVSTLRTPIWFTYKS